MDERYSRQVLVGEIGEEGQEKLRRSSVLIVGCGALGSTQASLLARAGLGKIRIVDRDILELQNLQRNSLFDEHDVIEGLPKTEAAARKLRSINSTIEIESFLVDVTPRNIEKLIAGMSLVLDGTDNFETRYIINDACIKHGIPWIYGGILGTMGMTMTIIPGQGPCFRCAFPEKPEPGSLPTCEARGVLNTAPAILASIQATEAIKILVGCGALNRSLLYLDAWSHSLKPIEVERVEGCPCCVLKRFDFLESRETSWTSALCGRNAVLIKPAGDTQLPLRELSEKLAKAGEVSYNGLLLRFVAGVYELVIFPDGRVIVNGTTDTGVARGLYARYIGS